MTPTEPTTEAGRRLLRAIVAWDLGERPDHEHSARVAILAIEAEARAEPRAEGLRERLPGLDSLLVLDAATIGRVLADRPDIWDILRAALAPEPETP